MGKARGPEAPEDDPSQPLLGVSTTTGLGPRATLRQVIASLSAATGALAMGMSLGWASPALGQLQEELEPLTNAQQGWLGGLVPLGALVGVPLASPFLYHFGRRGTILLSCLPMLVGWICLALPPFLPLLYLGRFMNGLASAWFGISVPVYIGETASAHLRGPLGSLYQNMVVTGIVIMSGTGALVQWRTLAWIAIPFPCITFILLLSLPASPVWLISKNKVDAARKALVWLRHNPDVEVELDRFSMHQNHEELGLKGLFRDRSARKVMLIMLGVGLANQLCGINVVLTYTDSILTEAGIPVPSELAGLGVFLLMQLATMLSTPLNQRVGRRPLLVTSLALCSLSMALLGLCFHINLGPSYSLAPLLCLIFFILSFSLGMGPMCYILLADFSLPRLAATAGTVTGLTAWSAAFLITLLYPGLVTTIGLPCVYYLYAAFSALGAIFVLCLLPETKGLTFVQIEACL